jgi:hypothetical protein
LRHFNPLKVFPLFDHSITLKGFLSRLLMFDDGIRIILPQTDARLL